MKIRFTTYFCFFSWLIFFNMFELGSAERLDELEDIFTRVYDEKIWGESSDGLGSSGSGSSAEASKPYVSFVNKFINKKKIRSVLDVGCGDGAITGYLRLGEKIKYIGIDVVEYLVLKNQDRYPMYTFYKLNAVSDPLPKVDLILCKDVLQHLSNQHIVEILKNIGQSSKYIIFTNDDLQNNCINKDISSGPFHRTIDLSKPPFSLNPMEKLKYKCPSGETKVIFVVENKNNF
jgi:SAM-dependent methyltransferase